MLPYDTLSPAPRGGPVARFYRWILGIGYERNVGGRERTVRYALGAVCLAAGLFVADVPLLAGVANGLLSAVLVVTGVYLVYEAQVGYCPMNHTLGRSTYRE